MNEYYGKSVLEDFAHRYEDCWERYEELLAHFAAIFRNADPPAPLLIEPTPDGCWISFAGHRFLLRLVPRKHPEGRHYQHFLTSWLSAGLPSNALIELSRLEIDPRGNVRPAGSSDWPWAVKNNSVQIFSTLFFPFPGSADPGS